MGAKAPNPKALFITVEIAIEPPSLNGWVDETTLRPYTARAL